MRLGGPILDPWQTPQEWIAAHRKRGYTATVWPLWGEQDDATIEAYVRAAAEADIVIAEVGAWNNNPLSRDEAERAQAIANIQARLALADRIGALCCVNIAGSRSTGKWDSPHPDNYTGETFDLIVQTVQTIIDGVKPDRTFYTLEPMPYMLPDDAASTLALLEAVDRPQFAVHYDPVNMVNSPRKAYATGEAIRDYCRTLGPYIKSVHAKDIILREALTVHLDEVPPGEGLLDYRALIAEIERINPQMPVLMEHFKEERAYIDGAAYIRRIAAEVGASVL